MAGDERRSRRLLVFGKPGQRVLALRGHEPGLVCLGRSDVDVLRSLQDPTDEVFGSLAAKGAFS